jgi:uncharacterized protein YceK
MNVDRHTEWASRMLAVLDMPDKTLDRLFVFESPRS